MGQDRGGNRDSWSVLYGGLHRSRIAYAVCGRAMIEQMKLTVYIVAIILAIALMAPGCMSYPRSDIGFWDQHVLVTGWGFTMATPYGPFNIGYLQWERNIPQPILPASPADVLPLVPPRATIP